MSTTATRAPAQASTKIADQRRPGVLALSAFALVAGLAVWFFASMIGYEDENTGTMVGIVVASIGLTFFFPALKTYLVRFR